MNFLQELQILYRTEIISEHLMSVTGTRKTIFINSSLHVVFIGGTFPLVGNTETLLKSVKTLVD